MLCLPNVVGVGRRDHGLSLGRAERKQRKALTVLLERHRQRLEPCTRGADRDIERAGLTDESVGTRDHNGRWRTPSGDDEEARGRDGCQQDHEGEPSEHGLQFYKFARMKSS
jgi:hypothetical protein